MTAARSIGDWFAGAVQRPPPPRQLVSFTKQLAVMTKAGLPMDQSLAVLAQQETSPRLSKAVSATLREVESGNGLAEAMARWPATFNPLYINMVAAGEAGGTLESVLFRLSTILGRMDEARTKLIGAMLYPAVILVVAVVSAVVLLAFVTPAFKEVFDSLGAPLPLPTRLLMGASDRLARYWWAILSLPLLAGVGLRQWAATRSGRLRIDRILLTLPVAGRILRRAAVARFSRTLSAMLTSGVPILDGMELAARTADNRAVSDAVFDSRAEIAAGKSIAAPLRESGVFPLMATQMIAVGEETGGLPEMLESVADAYDMEVSAAVDSSLKLLEPAMVLGFGGVVGGMIIAMYLPILTIATHVQ